MYERRARREKMHALYAHNIYHNGCFVSLCADDGGERVHSAGSSRDRIAMRVAHSGAANGDVVVRERWQTRGTLRIAATASLHVRAICKRTLITFLCVLYIMRVRGGVNKTA